MTKRKCGNGFLNRYLDATEGQESPDIFHMWVAMSMISASLDRKVWLDRGGMYTLYPNLYVCLVAGSARCRKSTAIKIGISKVFKPALEKIVDISSQKLTAESYTKALHRIYNIRKKSSMFIVNDELLTLFGRTSNENNLVAMLTTLYDCPEDWCYETIVRGKEPVYKAYPTLLSASTPKWLRHIVPTDSIGGGFTGRVLFIYQPDTARKFAHIRITEDQANAFTDCVNDLVEINKLEGGFVFSKKAEDTYSDWYTSIYNPDEGGDLLEGYMNRKADTLIKVAMLVSVSKKDSLVIEPNDIISAIAMMADNEKYLTYVMKLIEQTEFGSAAYDVIELIKASNAKAISHTTLLRAFSHKYNSKEIVDIINTLVEGSLITIDRQGGDLRYRILED